MRDLLTPRQRKLLRQAQADLKRKRQGKRARLTAQAYEQQYAAEVERRRTYKPPMPKPDPYDILVNDGTLI
jgi:hypothetical protein